MAETARRIVLASRPVGEPKPEDFRLEETAVPTPGPGEVLLRTRFLSLDPYMRANTDRYAVGDVVLGHPGWQTHAISNGNGLRKLDPKLAPISTALGVLGMPGMTAYAGLLEIGKPQPNETVVVSAASGAVGSIVGQIARIKGARAVGIAGGDKKCRYVKEELGFDDCVDHRAHDFPDRLKAACPKGIDVYFENVGGPVFEAVLPLFNYFARMPLCGLIAQYNATALPEGPNRVPQLMRNILTKRLTIRGFIVLDFAAKQADFLRDMSTWLREGKIKYREDIAEGIENAPRAFMGLLRGENFGKQLVRVS